MKTVGALGTWMGGYSFDMMDAYKVDSLAAAVFSSAALIWKARPSRVRIVRVAQAV
ncbi:MAG TPA: hypothetical protein VNO70_05770 [Blastocatellia bacterium]|nr:hypothetical protein [Blastocatellia bacterium]